jgi:oxidase EvaA
MARVSEAALSSNNGSRENSFLRSALTEENRFQSTRDFMSWFRARARAHRFSVRQIPFGQLDQWYFDQDTQNLAHVTGRFFRIEGISVATDFGPVEHWQQPIVVQPEIGILGIITREFEGTRYFLMQAKMEPGNVNTIQLSPTVQATKSNYTRAHKGKLPAYLEYFLDRTRSEYLVDQLQSEQGGRFLKKRNRNMIVQAAAVDHDLPLYDDFCWLTLGQIKRLLTIDNFVNMDARSVLSCIPYIDTDARAWFESRLVQGDDDFAGDLFASMIRERDACNSTSAIISWYTEMKTRYTLEVERIPLRQIARWTHSDFEIAHETGRFFSVIAVSVEAGNREVLNWTQPLLKSTYLGLIGFLTQKRNGMLHFLVQAKVEPGNLDVVDMAPTVSCSDAEVVAQGPSQPPFLERFLNASPRQVRYSTIQSEEGGRFYHFQNRYMVVELDKSATLDIPENYIWMTLGQMIDFVQHGYFNIEARSLLACVGLL